MADFIKGTKNTVQFINTSHEVKQTMAKLSKSALNAAAKVVRKYLRSDLPVRTKRLKNHVASWAKIDYRTGQPELQIGFQSWQKVRSRGKKPSSANPHWIEFGVNPHQIKAKNAKAMGYNDDFYGSAVTHRGTKGTHILRNTVYNHIDEIRAAQTEFLTELNNSIEAAGGKIIDSEEVEDD